MHLRRFFLFARCAAALSVAFLPGCATNGSHDDEFAAEDETDMSENPRRTGLPSWNDRGVQQGVAIIPFNGMTLHPDAAKRLDPVLVRLRERPAEHAILAGFARDQDSEEYSRQLAEARACIVRDWFTGEGITPGRLHTVCLAPDLSTGRDAVEIAVFTPSPGQG